MYALDVILDWLTEHSDGFRADPADLVLLAALRERGAPEALLELYRRVGKGAVGLLPCGTFDGLYPLLDPADVLALQECEGMHPDLPGAWPFAGDGDGWLVLHEGAVYYVGPCGAMRVASSTEELLFRHMEGLLGGKFAWNPARETYVPSRQLPDLARIPRVVEQVAGPVALRIWTGEILGDLMAGFPVDLSGVGKLVVSRHSPSCRLDPVTGRIQPERPHRGVARLRFDRHGVLNRRLNDEGACAVTRPVAIRGVPLDPIEGLRLAEALVDALAEILGEERVVAWPRLGEFSVQTQPGARGVARKVVTFVQYPVLERALNLEL